MIITKKRLGKCRMVVKVMDSETRKKINEISSDLADKLTRNTNNEVGLLVLLVFGIMFIVVGLFGFYLTGGM